MCANRLCSYRQIESGDTTIKSKLKDIHRSLKSSKAAGKNEADKMEPYMRSINQFFTWLSLMHPDTWQEVKIVDTTGTKVCEHT